MLKNWRFPFYLFFFGLLTFVGALWKSPQQQTYSPTEVLGATANLNLFVEPDDGRQPLLDIIGSAQKEILTEVYLLSDPETKLYLSEADKRGADVKVILEEHPFGGGNINDLSRPELEQNGVEVRWSNRSFTLTHEKTIIIDGRVVCILNMNLTKTAFTKNREYNVCDRNLQEVAEVRNIFLADWERRDYLPREANLVVSPDNSRGKLTAFIKSATKSLDIEMEVLEDSRMVDLLAERAKQIPVRVILPPLSKVDANTKALEKIKARVLSSPYVHAKLIIADGQRAYLGSINFSSQSLDRNRELGILVSQSDIIERLIQYFEQDWGKASE